MLGFEVRLAHPAVGIVVECVHCCDAFKKWQELFPILSVHWCYVRVIELDKCP